MCIYSIQSVLMETGATDGSYCMQPEQSFKNNGNLYFLLIHIFLFHVHHPLRQGPHTSLVPESHNISTVT